MESFFNHYAANERLYTASVMPVCDKHGLTYMEFTVLMFLANNPRFDTASDIVRYRHLTKSHVSLSVRSLEDKGLVKGAYHLPNRRTIHLTVLPAAHGIVADGRAAQQAFFQTLLWGFSQEECRQLLSFLTRIDENIAHHNQVIQTKQE